MKSINLKISIMKKFKIECEKSGLALLKFYYQEGTIEQLVKYYSYTLEVGVSFQHEKGNKKVNQFPKTISSLISSLNNAVNNAAANGCSNKYYRLIL